VDPWFIVHSAPKEARLITTARQLNDSTPHYVVNEVKAALQERTSATVACLGLAFDADIHDLRESPAMEIA
jgi:UDP-N-acetyl-D-mannosaminuronic acid dehydrogenase